MISLVVPIYNEEELIPRLHAEIVKSMDRAGQPWKVFYINDGSRDRSLDLLRQEQEADPRIVIVDLSRNWGHQSALTAGLSVADGDAIIMMDGDLQDPPAVLPELLKAWEGGAEVVIAVRRSRRDSGLRGLMFRAFYKVLGFLSDYPIPLNAGIFGLLDRKAVDAINRLHECNRYLPGMRSWVGYKTALVGYDRQERDAGDPKQNFWRLFRYALDAIFSFSYKPLRLSLFMGLITSLFSMAFGAFLVFCKIKGWGLFGEPVVAGYTSTIVSVLFLAGVQLISIGVLGEYIGRIYDEVKRRPLFFIREVYQAERSADSQVEETAKSPEARAGTV
jgi:dolichol-phosphate mannosyltransferase